MAKKKVIIQKLNGIELLSCIDILCLWMEDYHI